MKSDFMMQALRLAQMNEGLTSINPSVGCVITQNNLVIATGATNIGGAPHAESIAIQKAIQRIGNIENCELFTTLEPCSHFGKTPPCCDTIIKHGIRKVYFGSYDPDEKVNSCGIKMLRDSGTIVEQVILSEIDNFYAPYFCTRINNRSFITAKIACSLDGRIADRNGKSKWLTSEKTRIKTIFSRYKYDGIAVGGNTYRIDSPQLTCRALGLEDFSPHKFVISNSIKSASGFTILQESPQNIAKNLFQTHKIQHLLLEGGANVISQFLKDDLVDRLIVIYSPIILGGKYVCTEDVSMVDLINTARMKIMTNEKIDEDLIVTYERH